jgi:hypothetical protein
VYTNRQFHFTCTCKRLVLFKSAERPQSSCLLSHRSATDVCPSTAWTSISLQLACSHSAVSTVKRAASFTLNRCVQLRCAQHLKRL